MDENYNMRKMVLRGASQIIFSESEMVGALILLAVLIASPIQVLGAIWSLLVAAASVRLVGRSLGMEPAVANQGIYGFNAALAGIAAPLVTYQNRWDCLPQILIATAVISVACVLLMYAMRRWLDPRALSPYALPFSLIIAFTALIRHFLPASSMGTFYKESSQTILSDFVHGFGNGAAQVVWIFDARLAMLAGAVTLLAILLENRRGFLVAVWVLLLSSLLALALQRGGWLGGYELVSGLFGYGSVLLSLGIYGRMPWGLRMLAIVSVLSVLNVLLTGAIAPILGLWGVPLSGFVWSLLAMVGSRLGRG